MTGDNAVPVDDDGDFLAGLPPQDAVALDFMTRKGLGHLEPVEIVEATSQRRWIYSYVLPKGGELDLRVEWREDAQEWDVRVVDFHKRF